MSRSTEISKANSIASLVKQPIMLYDGKCVFCNGAASFAFKNEKNAILKFASLQSSVGQRLSAHFGLPTENFKSFVIVNNGQAYTRYAAAIQLGYLIGGRYAILASILDTILPDFIGNPIYSLLWPMRKIFGASEQCILPSQEMRARILEGTNS